MVDILMTLKEYWNQYGNIIIATIVIIIILILQSILVRITKRSVKKAHLPPEAANGLVLAIRMIAIFGIFTILTSYAGFTTEALALSGFIGAAIGFGSTQTVGNLIAGMYVMLTRPFRIGDYVRIGGEEGIVREISLNYTRLLAPDGTRVLVPNRSVINQNVRRYRRVIETEADREENTALAKTISFLRDTLDQKEIHIYPFDVAVSASYSFETTTRVFDEVCKEWEKKFGYTPTYYVSELLSGQTKYKIFLKVEDPRKILQFQPEFLKALLDRLEQTKT